MRNRISLFILLALLVPAGAAQQKEREKPQRDAPRTERAVRQAEEAQRRTQAIDILKGVVENAAEIKETDTYLAVLTGALDLLWKHDEAYTRAQFIKSAAALSDRFASNVIDTRERAEIRSSMEVLLKAFARRDPQQAERLLNKFQKLLEDMGFSLSPEERLSLAQASLESDTARSAALAAKVLETGVPGSFPSFLNELEQRDPAAAASLFRTALSMLTGGRVYNPPQVGILSSYVFRESQLFVPMVTSDRGKQLEFGMFASPLSPPPSRDVNRALVTAYLTAAGSYLNTQIIGLEQRSDPDGIHVALCYFLVKKLHGYAQKLSLDHSQVWAVLDAKYTIVAERAKLSGAALSGLATVAQRIVSENTVFRFDSGDAAFAAAEKAVDPAERAELIAAGIRQLIDDGKFAEAVQKIDDVRDEKVQDQLNTYRSVRMAEVSIRKLEWHDFNSQVNRVSDARLRTYLVLSAAQAASNTSKKDMASEFLAVAMALISKIDDADARAAALVTTAGILFAAADTSWGAQVLNEGVKAINRAKNYDGRVYGVTLEAPKYNEWLPIPKSDLNHLFEQAAQRDWHGAIGAAQSIDSKALRSQAYIAACRNIL